MLLLDMSARRPKTAARKHPKNAARKRTRIISQSAPSAVPLYLDEVPFGVIGKLKRGVVQQPKPEHTIEITRWLALQRAGTERNELTTRCAAEHPEWFQSWNAVSMFDKSLRLPARGDVMMHIVEEPVSIPGNPPRSVIERWNFALANSPGSVRTYYMEPFFDVPTAAEAKPLMAEDLRQAVDAQWDRLCGKAARWGWVFKAERCVLDWLARQARKRELKLQGELYLELLRERELQSLFGGQKVAPQERTARRGLEARVAQRSGGLAGEDLHWIEEQLAQADPLVRAQVERMERDIVELGARVRARGPMTEEEARQQRISRRELGVMFMLGLITLRHSRVETYLRRDPLLLLEYPEEKDLLRLGAHWDEWNAVVDGRVQLCTFVHI